jgi:polysaccharide biosynthesis transport protein
MSMNDTTTDAASIFSPLWRRKWLILAVAILVAVGTYEYYKHQTPTYGATTELYLGAASEQQASGQAKTGLNTRSLSDQVGLINSPIISALVHRRLRAEHDPAAARGKAKAAASKTGDFIDVSTKAHSPHSAVKLGNAYAQTYIAHERADYRRSLKAEILTDRQQLLRLELPPSPSASKSTKSAASASTLQIANLADKISQLEASLSTFSGVVQVSPAKAIPIPLSPTPKKNAIFGFALGLLLAAIGAYGLSRVDRRLRSLAEIEQVFQTEILVALPSVKAPVVRPDGVRAPAKPLLEPLRRLHTTLHLGHVIDGARHSGPRVILFISSDAGDGKSTLVANLARVQSDSGQRVAVIEADFRRPVQARLLDAPAQRGLADVLSGAATVGAAMQPVASSAPLGAPVEAGAHSAEGAGVSTVVEPLSSGSISVLLSGGEVANPPALLGGDGMRELLRSVAEEYDYVLIDSPPPLEVSDVMPLLPVVDGIVIVARLGHTRRVSAMRLAQLLGRTSSAPVLGAVANCVPRKDIERYGLAWAPATRRGQRKPKG